jgi:hypothetical protein
LKGFVLHSKGFGSLLQDFSRVLIRFFDRSGEFVVADERNKVEKQADIFFQYN